jgi:hypothetical protein
MAQMFTKQQLAASRKRTAARRRQGIILEVEARPAPGPLGTVYYSASVYGEDGTGRFSFLSQVGHRAKLSDYLRSLVSKVRENELFEELIATNDKNLTRRAANGFKGE